MTLESIKLKHFSKLLLSLVNAYFMLFLTSCVQSSSPKVAEIVTTGRPSVMGSYDISLTSSSSIFNITGNCDPKSYGTEYSVNNGASWVDLGLCTTGSFSFNVVVYSTLTVQLRARTKFSHTASSYANIRVIIPPTANLLTFVTASNSALSDLFSPRMSFTMSPYMTGSREPPIMNTYNMDHLTTGIVYAP